MIYNAADTPNLSLVTDMSHIFWHATSFNGDISSWDVSSVTDMFGMFWHAAAYHQNMGAWYIVPDSTTIKWNDAPGKVGIISSQNILTESSHLWHRNRRLDIF